MNNRITSAELLTEISQNLSIRVSGTSFLDSSSLDIPTVQGPPEVYSLGYVNDHFDELLLEF